MAEDLSQGHHLKPQVVLISLTYKNRRESCSRWPRPVAFNESQERAVLGRSRHGPGAPF